MRRFRTFVFLAGRQLKQPWFWIFLILFALIGPVFVVLHSETGLAEPEMRPLLSESATIDHFDTSGFGSMAYVNKEAMLLFRDPNSESMPKSSLGFLYESVNPFIRTVARSTSSSSPLPVNDTVSGFHTYLFPVLMMVAGVMVVPSRRQLAIFHAILPCGRTGSFLMIVGVLVLQAVLLGSLAGASTWGALALTQGVTLGISWFVTEYFGALIVYGLGFGLLGVVVAELIRTRSTALLLGLVFLIGVWPFITHAQAQLGASIFPLHRASSTAEPAPNLIVEAVIWIASVPPEINFDNLRRSARILVVLPKDSSQGQARYRLGLLYKWTSLIVFATFWCIIGWLAFPKTMRAFA